MPPQRAARKAVSRRTRSSKRPHPDRNDGADLDGLVARLIMSVEELNAVHREFISSHRDRFKAQLYKQQAEFHEQLQAQTASIGSSAGSLQNRPQLPPATTTTRPQESQYDTAHRDLSGTANPQRPLDRRDNAHGPTNLDHANTLEPEEPPHIAEGRVLWPREIPPCRPSEREDKMPPTRPDILRPMFAGTDWERVHKWRMSISGECP